MQMPSHTKPGRQKTRNIGSNNLLPCQSRRPIVQQHQPDHSTRRSAVFAITPSTLDQSVRLAINYPTPPGTTRPELPMSPPLKTRPGPSFTSL